MAVKDQVTLLAQINDQIPDNTSGLVSPADVRGNFVDTVDTLFSGLSQLSGYQPLHGNLSALSGLSLVADRLPYANGNGSLTLTTLTSFARTLLDDASASAARTTLGLGTTHDVEFRSLTVNSQAGISIEINGGLVMDSQHSGTGTFQLDELEANRTYTFPDKSGYVALTSDLNSYQPLDATLTALAGLTVAANKGIYATGADAFATYDLNEPARSLGSLTDPNADRIAFWDDSAGAMAWLSVGAGLSLSGTTLSLSSWPTVTGIDIRDGIEGASISASSVGSGEFTIEGSFGTEACYIQGFESISTNTEYLYLYASSSLELSGLNILLAPFTSLKMVGYEDEPMVEFIPGDEGPSDLFSVNCKMLLPNLPTSDPAVAGQLWCDTANGRVLKLSAG